MSVTLGSLAFDGAHTTVREFLEEVGGGDARAIEIRGLIVGESAAADIEARLDAILEAASDGISEVTLCLREGRELQVCRKKFERNVSGESLVGSFVLELEARDPYEVASSETSSPWTIAESGATKLVTAGGGVFSRPRITLAASGTVVEPSFGDGSRTIGFSGTVADGVALVFDAVPGMVSLAGEDVTAYSFGEFPRLAPGGTTLTYTDGASSSHAAAVTVAFRDRWC